MNYIIIYNYTTLYNSICVIIITIIINNKNVKSTRMYVHARLGLIIIHFMVYLIVKKPSTFSLSTTVFIFSTYGLDPWRQYRTGISIVHILVSTKYVSGDDCLYVCLELKVGSQYDARTSVALRCIVSSVKL